MWIAGDDPRYFGVMHHSAVLVIIDGAQHSVATISTFNLVTGDGIRAYLKPFLPVLTAFEALLSAPSLPEIILDGFGGQSDDFRTKVDKAPSIVTLLNFSIHTDSKQNPVLSEGLWQGHPHQ
jgi:hypothetical protein